MSPSKYAWLTSDGRSTRITPTLRAEAAAWCARLSRDRAQPAWSIRFTRADIEASAATQIAWRAYCEVKGWLAKDTAPRDLWAAAEALLREIHDDPPPPPTRPPAPPKPAPPPKPIPPPPKKTQGPAREKERSRMAKKQTRRSISVSKKMYDQARAFADAKGVSLSQLTETALAHAIEHFYKNKVE